MDYNVTGPDGVDHVITGPDGASDAEVIQQAQKLFPGPGIGESFARGVQNNFPLANQAIAAGSAMLGDKSYSENLEQQNKDIAEAKDVHPIPYGAGAVVGGVAPAFIPGVGEAGIAGQAALGAAYGVGSTDVLKNPEEALKGAAVGGITGGVLGAILPNGEKAAKKLTGMANQNTVESMGFPAGLLNKPQEEIEAMGQHLHDLGLDRGSMDDKINIAGAKLKEIGSQIATSGANTAPLQDATPFVARLHEHMQNSADIFEPGANAEAGAYRQAIANLQQPDLTFDKLQQLKSAVGDRAFDAMHNVRNDALANVYGVYKDALKSMVDGSPAEYQDLMSQYSTLLDVNKALGKMRGIQNAGGAPAKGFGMAGKLGGMVTGGNVPATTALSGGLFAMGKPFMGLGAATTIINNPGAMGSIQRGLAEAIPKAAQAVTAGSMDAVTSKILSAVRTNPQQLGRFAKPLMQAAQTGGTQGIAATHFVLANQYPEYNEMMNHLTIHGAHQVVESAMNPDEENP